MTNFWNYESRDTYNARKAQTWAEMRMQDEMELLQRQRDLDSGLSPEAASPLGEDNVFATWEKLKERDLDEIQKKPKDNFGSGILGGIDSITSTIFGGEIRQPWDLLRPIQRVLEAEQRYISKPLAKFGYETISGNDYEDLPSFLQFGLESLTSPTNWVGPGLIGKMATKAGFSAASRYAASESLPEYLAKGLLPSLAGSTGAGLAQEAGLPAWSGLPLAAFTSKGLNMAYGRQAQIKRGESFKANIVVPDNMKAYHGTFKDFEDFDPSKSGTNFQDLTFPGAFYVTKDPDTASEYADSTARMAQGKEGVFGPIGDPIGAQVRPLVVMPNTKLFDPDVDTLIPRQPNGLSKISEMQRIREETGLSFSRQAELAEKMRGTGFQEGRELANLNDFKGLGTFTSLPRFDSWSIEDKLDTKKLLKARGFSGINTPHEIIIWDKDVVRPLYSVTGRPDPGNYLRAMGKRDSGFALAAPGIAELLGGSPASARVLGMVANDDLPSDVRRTAGFEPDLDEATRKAAANRPFIRKAWESMAEGTSVGSRNEEGQIRRNTDGTYTYSWRQGVGDFGEKTGSLDEVLDYSEVVNAKRRAPRPVTEAEAGTSQTGPQPPSLEDQLRMSIADPQGAKTAGRILAADNAAKLEAQGAEAAEFYKSEEVKALMKLDGQKLLTELSKATKALNANNTPENLARVQTLRRVALRRFPIKGGAPESESMQELLDSFADATNDLFGIASRQEAIDFEHYSRSQTQNVRGKIANWLRGSDTGTNIVNYLNSRGLKLEDTWIVDLINFWSRKVALGSNYGARESDILRRMREQASASRVLTTEEITHRPVVEGQPWNPLRQGSTATVVTDPVLIQQARALAESQPDLGFMADGVLHLDDLITHKYLFDLTDEQTGLIEALDSIMRPHRTMEGYFGFDPDIAENGYPVHRQLLTSLQPVDETGLLREAQGGPVVTTRLGSKQGSNKPELFPTKSAGYAAGNHYLPFEEAQAARIAQGYRRMADDWLMRAVEDSSKVESDFIPKTLSDNLASEKHLGNQLGSLANMVAKASAKPQSLKMPKWKPDTPELESLRNDIITADKMKNGKAKKAELAKLDARVKLFQAEQSKRYKALELDKAKALANKGVYNTEFNRRFYPADIGEALNEINRVDSPDAISRRLNTFNETIRPIMATLDASFVGVQGLIALMSRPSSFFTAMANLTSNGYAGYIDRKLVDGAFDRFIQSGGHWAARNDFAEFLAPSALQRLPGVGNLVKGSNDMFVRFGNILRMEMFDRALALDPKLLGTDDPAIKGRMDLARIVGLISGYTPKNPSQIERTALFAPRFFRSQLGLLADSVSKHDFSSAGAARSMAVFIMGGVALVHAANAALGQETVINPDDPNFMRVRIGSQDISPFGVWDTLVRAIAKSSDGSEDGFEYLARVKASPAIRTLWDVWEGESLSGEQLDSGSPSALLSSAAKIATGYGPISGSTLVTKPPDITDPTSLMGTGLQFLGVKSSPLSASEEMTRKRESLSRENYSRPWADLEPFEKDQLRRDHDLEVESTSEISKQFDYRSAISERFQQRQEQLDSQLPVGSAWREAYQKLNREKVGAYDQWAQQSPEAQASMRETTPRNANDAARQAYYGLFDRAAQEQWTPDELSEQISDLESALTPEQMSYIERNSGLRDTPRVKEYKAAQKVLRPYWDLADTIWDKFSPRLDPSIQASSLQEYVQNLTVKLREEGIDDRIIARRIQTNPVLREIDRATRTLRERYRRAHPEVDAELVKWYEYKSAS